MTVDLQGVLRDEVHDASDELRLLLDLLRDASDAAAFQEGVQRMLRILHNIKGAGRMAGALAVEQLSHALEDRVSVWVPPLGDTDRQLVEAAITVVRQAADGVDVSARLDSLLIELALPAHEASARSASETLRPRQDKDKQQDSPGNERVGRVSVRVEAARLNRLMMFAGEFLTLQGRYAAQHEALESLYAWSLQCLRLPEHERLGAVASLHARLEQLVRADRALMRQFGYHSADFSAAIKQVRMLPLQDSVSQWRHITSEAGQWLGRPVHFDAEVAGIDIDKEILDALRDPLMHLLRNAVDHGIEPLDERLASGKPAEGLVRVRAQTVGTMVHLDVYDDGRGIRATALRGKALEKGFITAESAAAMDDAMALQLIFMPGFSTASEVNALSGRGVGLDVVHSRVVELGGRVEVVAQGPLGGAMFRLLIPASLVSARGILVRAQEATLAVPTVHVQRTIRVRASDVQASDGGSAVRDVQGAPLRLCWLHGADKKPTSAGQWLTVVVVAQGRLRIGLVVENILGEIEYVAKPLPWNLRRVPGVCGLVILGDGAVAAIVDVAHLLGGGNWETVATLATATTTRASRRRRILVVDDSLVSRTLGYDTLTAAGYEVEVAADGEAAWQLLQDHSFDLVLTDIEMPRLDGINLTRRIRGDSTLAQLPVIVASSRGEPQDLAEGGAAGADEYIIKGQFSEDGLLAAVARHV